MKHKKLFISAVIFAIALLTINATKSSPKDILDKRNFIISIEEIKTPPPPKKKLIEDELNFKKGTIFSTYLFDKFDAKAFKYEITKDSTFVDEVELEHHLTEIEVSATNSDNQTVNIKCRIEDENIKGEIKILKKDKLKKRFEFSGKEKEKKK